MQITLNKVRSDANVTFSRTGDALTINDETFDFADLGRGENTDADEVDCSWILGDVRRDEDGQLHIALAVPYMVGESGDLVVLDDPDDGPLAVSVD